MDEAVQKILEDIGKLNLFQLRARLGPCSLGFGFWD